MAGLNRLEFQRGQLADNDKIVVVERQRPRNAVLDRARSLSHSPASVSPLSGALSLVEIADRHRPARYTGELRLIGRGIVVLCVIGRDLMPITVSVLKTFSPVSDPSNTGKSRNSCRRAPAVIARTICSVGKTTAASRSEGLVLRLDQIHGGRCRAVLGLAVDRIDKILVNEILRSKFEVLGVAAFPRRRMQVAGGDFAFAAIEL